MRTRSKRGDKFSRLAVPALKSTYFNNNYQVILHRSCTGTAKKFTKTRLSTGPPPCKSTCAPYFEAVISGC